ncbi:hypothetical protein HMPREF1982_03193 [Clostridiales bacterium oral taxon 876 str. F0540]|nr:hypothetical protein HMPREF1982_03193 [Clostridiales bacterium oral taxon 876 str. F0540]
MLIIQNKNKTKAITLEPNEFEVNKNTAYIRLKKKNGSTVDTKVDAEDLQRVLDRGTWFAEWHKDYNSYLVMNYIDSDKRKEKQSLQSFILEVDPRTPIRHLNGDTLDNRKSNLEIYNKNSYNNYKELDGETAEVILMDSHGRNASKTIIDKADLYRVINNGYPWVYYKVNEKPYAVANTPSGRLYLDRFIMATPEDMVVQHVNHNTLDNRKINLNNVKASEE